MSESKVYNNKLIKQKIEELKPFNHEIQLTSDFKTICHPARKNRLESVWKHISKDLGSLKNKIVLDVACNCGGSSARANRKTRY